MSRRAQLFEVKETIVKNIEHPMQKGIMLWAVVALISLASRPMTAQSDSDPLPTTQHYFSTTPVQFEQARQTTESLVRAQVVRPMGETPLGGGGGTVAPEIVELARALKNDPDLIYQYVHDNIEFSPLWGALKGPVGTLLDGRGDSFDQSALMIALLNQASIANPSISNATFEYGQLSLSSAQLQSWLGVDNNPYSISGVLAQGGIPATVNVNGSAVLGHVWVKVSINGTPYVFDPAFKPHSWSNGIVGSLASIMGYSKSGFIADANPTVTATSIQGVNRTQLRSDLSLYANTLATYIRNNQPEAGVKDILGGGTIMPASLVNGQTVRQTTNPFQNGTPTDWTSIPSNYHATLSVTLPGAAAQPYNSDDIYGHRLSIFFNTAYVPTLSLDGTAIVSGSAASKGAQVGIVLSISLPWATFANQSRTQFISAHSNAEGGGYIVQTGWDQVGRGMIEKHRKLLSQAIASGGAANSEAVLGESLAVQGYTWLAEVAAQQQLSDRLLGTVTQYYYGGGIVGESVGTTVTSPYVDLPLNFIDTPTRLNGAATQTANSLTAFLDGSGVSSAFESASLEQTQAKVTDFAAASTVKLLDMAMQNGDTLYDINSANWSTVQPLLTANYNAADLTSMYNSWVSQGFRVIAPLHGKISVGTWTGVGYKTMKTSGTGESYGEIISGALSGGFGGVEDAPDTAVPNFAEAMPAAEDSPTADMGIIGTDPGVTLSGGTGLVLADPVDHFKGSYQYQHVDLAVGPKDFPYGLSFERSYDSDAQGIAGPLGAGWTHNYAITAAVDSDGFTGMAQGSPLGAVSSIVALYVSSDLINGQAITGQSNLEYFALETIVNRWFTDQLTQNVVNVSTGWNSEQFTKMADGSYTAQLGSATILDGVPGSFRYRTKTGVTMNFNSANQISSCSNAAGASVNFSYAGGQLSSVTNSATGRQLNLHYSGTQITSVDDGSRTISYGYTSGNLTSFTDGLGQQTTFVYDKTGAQDTAGHLTQVFYPSHPNSAFVTNFYDSLGRVMQQRSATGNVTQMFFAGERTEIVDPAGTRNVWYNDPRGNVTAEIQDYGLSRLNLTTFNTYDAQSNLLATVMPEGNFVVYSYDNYFNALSVTQYPKPNSSLSPRVQSFTYTVPVSSLPNFEQVLTYTDPNTNVTTFSYNSGTGTLHQITQPPVAKPGMSSNSTPQQNFTYTSIGLPQTVQDAEGRITRYDYDPTHADQVMKSTVDYGGLNLITQYGYDSYGDANSVIDADSHTTSSHFDALRHLTEMDAPITGIATTYTYYPDGQVNSVARQASGTAWETTQYTYTLSDKVWVVTDPLGNTTTSTYDVDDRVLTVTTQVTSTQNRQRSYSYDALSRLYQLSDTTLANPGTILETHAYTPNGAALSFTDANSHTTVYTYDGFDRLFLTTYPDQGTESYQYDANGNVSQKKTRSAGTIGFIYDALNRVITKTPQGEAAGAVSYGYDLSGRLMQASDGSTTTPYQVGYDTAGRANSYTDQQGRNTQVQYDGVGNRTRLQWPANTNGANAYYVTYQYDMLNRITEIDENGLATKPLAKYDWDSLSRQTLITYGDGTTDAYSQYDVGDNLQTLTQSYAGADNSVTFNYTWQKNHQRATTSVSDSAFQYVPSAGTTNYAPADPNNGYTSVGSTSFTYDSNRNLTFDGFNTLSYDVENRLTQAQNLTNGTSLYLYDPLGNRKQKQTGGVTTQFVLAGGDEIADYTGTGAGAAQMLTVRGAGGLPVAAITPAAGGSAEAVVYYHRDVIGSTVAVTQPGTSGAAEVYTYGEFGAQGAGSWATYRYAGYRFDSETGLYFVNARYYSPNLGRFLQTDPIGIAGGANVYAYVGNDPINGTDHAGLSPDELNLTSNGDPSQNNGPPAYWQSEYALYGRDLGASGLADKEVLYTVGRTDGQPMDQKFYVSEVISPQLSDVAWTGVGGTSTDPTPNQFDDTIGNNPFNRADTYVQQYFIISTAAGLRPSQFSRIPISSGGNLYYSDTIHMTPDGSVTITPKEKK